MNYQCKAKQIEARQALGSLAKCQQAYYSEYDIYSTSKDSIGFSTKGDSRYEYVITDVSEITYNATATSLTPGIARKGAGDDEWTIEQDLILVNTKNPCKN
ncbi:MAG: type IV pilin protein [Bacteroidota bacterium]